VATFFPSPASLSSIPIFTPLNSFVDAESFGPLHSNRGEAARYNSISLYAIFPRHLDGGIADGTVIATTGESERLKNTHSDAEV
jgi:hypothetical protein